MCQNPTDIEKSCKPANLNRLNWSKVDLPLEAKETNHNFDTYLYPLKELLKIYTSHKFGSACFVTLYSGKKFMTKSRSSQDLTIVSECVTDSLHTAAADIEPVPD